MSRKVNIFKEIIADFHQRSLDHIMDRAIDVAMDVPKIVSLVGARRVGKTSICLQIVKKLRQRMLSERLTYINFEDDRLYPLELQDLDTLLQAYYELYPSNKEQLVYFFFDEVQEVANWEKFVRRVFDQENCRIYITGSSSKLLSRELSTGLRGRTLPYEIFPLSFTEFFDFNHLVVDEHSSKGKAVINHTFEKYLIQGGLPELVFLPEEMHRRTVSEYIDLMLYRDLAERFGIRNPALLKYLLKYCLQNMATLLSTNKLFQDLKSQGYAIGKNTLYEYLEYLEEAYVLFRTSVMSSSVRKQAINPNKIYSLDPAFRTVMTNQPDKGHVLENLVFLALRRIGHQPNYWKGKQEVDFTLGDKVLINVSYDLSEGSTRSRELSGLDEAMWKMSITTSLLITKGEEEEVKLTNGVVRIVPAGQFLLNPHTFI